MFFKNYQYFLAIVEYGGLTRAAEALYISQPSLSKYLSRLEANLGVELFDHSASPLKLTYAGQRYYDYVKRLQLMEQRLTRELEDIRADESGEIHLGIAQWRGAILLPRLLPRFHKVYPRVDVTITEGRASQVEAALTQGKLDFCLMNLPSHYPNLTKQEILWNEKVLLVGNRAHPEVQRALEELPVGEDGYQRIDIAFLENEDFITLKPGQNMTVASEHLFGMYNLRPRSQWATENMYTAISMVSSTLAFTMMPEAGAQFGTLPENVAYFSIHHSHELFPFAAVYRKDTTPNKWIRTLIDLTQEVHREADEARRNIM